MVLTEKLAKRLKIKYSFKLLKKTRQNAGNKQSWMVKIFKKCQKKPKYMRSIRTTSPFQIRKLNKSGGKLRHHRFKFREFCENWDFRKLNLKEKQLELRKRSGNTVCLFTFSVDAVFDLETWLLWKMRFWNWEFEGKTIGV